VCICAGEESWQLFREVCADQMGGERYWGEGVDMGCMTAVGLLEKQDGQGEVLPGRAIGYVGYVVERG
jgi:hypothetical protein